MTMSRISGKIQRAVAPCLQILEAVQNQIGGLLPAAATHVEVLLPNGKSGWLPASAVRLFDSERLCYAKTAKGDWKIATYDQIE